MMTWEKICAMLEELPGAAQDPPGGREVVRVFGKVVAYPAANERSRPDGYPENEEFVIIKTDYSERAALLQQDSQTFFVTPHYQDYPGVIVRLSTVKPDQLRELLTDAWRLVAPKRLVRDMEQKP
jgi:hypothetical protein